MASGDKKLNVVTKRILGWQSFRDNLLEYLVGRDEDLVQKVYKTSGVFKSLGLAADGNDKFKITGFTGEAVIAIDGLGNFLDLDSRSEDVEGVQFENTAATDYYVGIRKASVPDGLTVSQQDGQPNFDTYEEIVGWEGTPNSVADDGDGTMTFVVDAVTEAGRSNAGRKVSVWKKVPGLAATTEAVAWEEKLTVAWAAGNNKIYTVANFGQGSTPSTTASDYVVALHGPRVSRDTDLRTEADYCFIGIVTGKGAGNPPDTFDTSDQELMDIPLSDLAHIVRYENVPPNRLKIDVKALAAEENTNTEQIRVSGWDGVGGAKTVFKVDELGNVTIEGDLEVKGETTQQDLVQVNSSETITQNLTAGDANTDTHLIKGEWTHNVVGTGDVFTIDGDTGRIGIGGAYDGTNALKVTGALLASAFEIASAVAAIKLYETDADPDEKKWWVVAADGIFELGLWDDAEATYQWFLQCRRSDEDPLIVTLKTTATDGEINLESSRIGLAGDNSGVDGIECFQDVLPNGTRDIGATAAASRWQTLFLDQGVDIEHSEPLIRIKETGAPANEGVWYFIVDASLLELRCYNDAEDTDNYCFAVSRTGNDPSAVRLRATTATGEVNMIAPRVGLGGDNSGVDAIECFHNVIPNGTETIGHLTPSEKLWTAIYGNLIQARHTAPGFEWYDTGDGSDEKRWRMEVDANSDLRLITLTDLGVPGSTVFKVDRDVNATTLASMNIGTHLYPETDNSFDLGKSLTLLRWRHGYFTGRLLCDFVEVTGKATTHVSGSVSLTNEVAGVAAGTGTVKMSGATDRSSTGWLTIFVDGNERYIPYWTTIIG